MTTDREADEALADDLAEALVGAWNAARERDPALPVLTDALRAARWVPLTEVEKWLREVWLYHDAADLVASAARRAGWAPSVPVSADRDAEVERKDKVIDAYKDTVREAILHNGRQQARIDVLAAAVAAVARLCEEGLRDCAACDCACPNVLEHAARYSAIRAALSALPPQEERCGPRDIPVARITALVALLWPDEITPTAKRMLLSVCEEYRPAALPPQEERARQKRLHDAAWMLGGPGPAALPPQDHP